MVPFVVAAAIVAASCVAANSPAADTRSKGVVQELAKGPWQAVIAPFRQLLGLEANRFELNGPLGIATDAIKNLKETVGLLILLNLQNPENSGFDTPFSLFSNGEALKCTKEALRHTTDAFVRFPEMTAALVAHFNKTTDSALAVSSQKMHEFLTHFRTMLLPRVVQDLAL